MDKKVTRLRPYDQHGEDITIACTLDSKIISAKDVSWGTYDRDATNIHDRKVLHSESLHHIFSNLLLPAKFSFTTPSPQTATSSPSPWEALPVLSSLPLRLPRCTLTTQKTSITGT